MTVHSVLLQQIFDHIDELVFVLDESGAIVSCNAPAASAIGYAKPAAVASRPFLSFVADSSRELAQTFITNGKPWFGQELKLKDINGVQIPLRADIHPVHEGRNRYYMFVGRENGARDENELDLLRFSNVIQNTLHPIQITDTNGTMVYVNSAFEKMCGYSKEELIGRNPNLLSSGKHSKDFWRTVWKRVLSGEIWVGEVENRRKDGSPLFCELLISPVVNQHGRVIGFLGGHRDITDQKFLEQQLLRSQRLESIGTLAAGIAHEVGNPLSAISSVVQVLMRTSEDVFVREKLELIKNQINRINRIIRDLVDYSRPSPEVRKPTDINSTVREALTIVQYGKKVKNITFEAALEENLPPAVVVPDQLMQVFINILMNAVDALEGAEGTITITSRREGNRAEVAISDTGKGIANESREKIFQPFFTTKEAGKGTGLGLWVSHCIVQSFNGSIRLDSEPGTGSAFTVSLPLEGQ